MLKNNTPYHPKIRHRMETTLAEANRTCYALARIAEWIQLFDLEPLLDHCDRYWFSQEYLSRYVDGERFNEEVDRFWLSVVVDTTHKPELRPILLKAFDSFEKGWQVDNYNIRKGPQLQEVWHTSWARIHNPHGTDAYNSLYIYFESPATEGHQLSDTCTIEKITTHEEPKTSSRLTVTCRRDENNE